MLIAASWPSNRLAAVTKRTGSRGTCSSARTITRPRYPTVGRQTIAAPNGGVGHYSRRHSPPGLPGARLMELVLPVAKPLRFDPIDEARRQWDAHGWPEAASGMALVTSVVRAQQIFLARIEAVLRPFGLTFARYELLMLLAFTRSGSMPLSRAGARLQVHPASVTNAVDRLEAQGLIRRLPHGTDRRTTLAEILPAGRELAAEATASLNRGVFERPGLDPAETEQVVALLGNLRRSWGDFAAEQAGDPAGKGAS